MENGAAVGVMKKENIKLTGCGDHKFCYIKIKDGEYDHSKDYYGDSVILDFDKDNKFYNVLNKISTNVQEVDNIISQIYKKNNIQFYIELTGPMNSFVQEELKNNLNIAFKNAYNSKAEREKALNSFYNKVISQEDVTNDLEELYKRGVPADTLTRFLNFSLFAKCV